MEAISALISQATLHPVKSAKSESDHGYQPPQPSTSSSNSEDYRSVFDTCRHPIILKPTDQPCSHFFQQQGAIDWRSYIRLKHEERMAVIQFHAAAIIQAVWRGFLVRANMKICIAAITKIQALVRGFLARRRFKELYKATEAQKQRDFLDAAATKIQAWWRGILSRKNKFDFKRYKEIKEKNEALRRSIEVGKAEVLQELKRVLKECTTGNLKSLYWRRIFSKLSFLQTRLYKPAKYDEGRTPEANTIMILDAPSYDDEHLRINELEQALLKSLNPRESCQSSSCVSVTRSSTRSGFDDSSSGQEPCIEMEPSPPFSLTNLSPSLEKFIVNKLPEVVDEMSETRIAELYAYLASLETDMKTEKGLEKLVKRVGGIQNLKPEDLEKLEESKKNQRERAEAILNLAKAGLTRNTQLTQQILLHEKDSVDAMFPSLPKRTDVVQPDIKKVEALKDAIRMFKKQSRENEERELQRMHVLLRTRNCPGVYSDIYTTELTEIERKLKALKFWKRNVIADRRAQKEDEKRKKRLQNLFAHALRISNAAKRATEEEEDESVESSAEYEAEFCGESLLGEDDEFEGGSGMKKQSCYYLPPLNPQPPPPTPDAQSNVDDVSEHTELTSTSGRSNGFVG